MAGETIPIDHRLPGPSLTLERSYLDHNATTPLRPEARDAMVAACAVHGNPSSVHAEGRVARAIIDDARRQVASLVGCEPSGVIFTSGGTEALNMALSGGFSRGGVRPTRLLASAGEHPAVLGGHGFASAEIVPLATDGRLDLDALRRLVDGAPVLLAVQAANNETGVIQPVREAAAIVHAAGGAVICDAVQAAGKIACDFNLLGADAVAVSAHKFGGPKGVGALCFRDEASHLEHGVVRGGGQERGLRAGTENIVGIVGMGAACASAEAARMACSAQLEEWRDRIEGELRSAVTVFGQGSPRLPNTSCFALPGVDAQVLLMGLDLAGVAVSAGSACAAGTVRPSHVLAAMGVEPALATRALRVSLGWTTGEGDVEKFVTAFAVALGRMRPRRAA